MEGWAQANQGTPAAELAVTAWDDHEKGRSLTLRQLVAPDWYWYSGPAAYNQGAPLVNYLLRVYGPERFLKLYTTCQQATFEADCRATLGIGLDELDAAFWADTEQIARRAGPPTRIWLKSLKLDPGIDPAAWDAFLADYFAAADRLLAPYEHIRLTTVAHHSGSKTHYKERQELLRSGSFARLRKTDNSNDLAYLGNPDCSIQARRGLGPPAEPWTIIEDSPASRPQSYQWVLHSDRLSVHHGAGTRGPWRVDLARTSPAVSQGYRLLDRLRSRQAQRHDQRRPPPRDASAADKSRGQEPRPRGLYVRLRRG